MNTKDMLDRLIKENPESEKAIRAAFDLGAGVGVVPVTEYDVIRQGNHVLGVDLGEEITHGDFLTLLSTVNTDALFERIYDDLGDRHADLVDEVALEMAEKIANMRK